MITTMYNKAIRRSKLLTVTLVSFYILIAILLLIIKGTDNGIANTVKYKASYSNTSYSSSGANNSVSSKQY